MLDSLDRWLLVLSIFLFSFYNYGHTEEEILQVVSQHLQEGSFIAVYLLHYEVDLGQLIVSAPRCLKSAPFFVSLIHSLPQVPQETESFPYLKFPQEGGVHRVNQTLEMPRELENCRRLLIARKESWRHVVEGFLRGEASDGADCQQEGGQYLIENGKGGSVLHTFSSGLPAAAELGEVKVEF